MRAPRHDFTTVILAALLAAGCVPAPGTAAPRKPVGPKGSAAIGTPRQTPQAATPITPATLTSPAPGGIASVISNNGGGIITNNGAGLTGKVKAPASLLTDGGAGVISNNGGGYRLLALPQAPVAGARVVLVDGAGIPIKGADGQPLVTTTDAAGAYAFPVEAIAANWVVVATLPGDKGALQAIVPVGSAKGVPIDVDLVSALTTTYILDRFVATQEDRQQTLDRLPADVEAQTRARAATALGDGAPPARADAASLIAAVDALRRQDRAFDDQMEAVRKLLIPAGLSDLGAGRPATEVPLGFVSGLAAGPDGKLYIPSPDYGRVWRLEPNGTLVTVAGNGTPADGSLDGVKAVDAGLDQLERIMFDPQGRLLLQEHRRLTRLGPDGRLTQLHAVEHDALGWNAIELAFPRGGATPDDVLAFTLRQGFTDVIAIDAARRATTLTSLARTGNTPPAATGLPQWLFLDPTTYGREPSGRIVLAHPNGDEGREGPGLATFDPATLKFAAGPAVAPGIPLCVDGAGNVFVLDAARKLSVVVPGQPPATVLTRLDPDFGDYLAAARMPDGTCYVAVDQQVLRVKDGALVVAAGTLGGVGSSPDALALVSPMGLALGPEGDLFVLEGETNTVYRLVPRQQAEVYHDDEYGSLAFLASDAQGRLTMLDSGNALFRIDPRQPGHPAVKLFGLTNVTLGGKTFENFVVTAIAVAPDGTVYMVHDDNDDFPTKSNVVRLSADGKTLDTLMTGTTPMEYQALAVGPTGELYVSGHVPTGDEDFYRVDMGRLTRWTAATGAVVVKDDVLIPLESATMGVDARGRVYFAQGDAKGQPYPSHRIWRLDPAAGTFTTIAGKGGVIFNGAGVDTSLETPSYPTFDAAGQMFLLDYGHKQIKRVPADRLP